MHAPLDALSALLAAHRGALVHTARREGAGPEDAVECVQDALCTFLRLAQEGGVPEDAARWPAFLHVTVQNAARNLRRRHRLARPHAPLDEHAAAADGPVADELLAFAEERVRLHACVAELCEIQRAVVTLRLLEEQGGEDVAAALGISRGYVDVLLSRAKASLRSCMAAAG